MRRIILPALLPFMAGCALLDPHIPTGPEQGYCFAPAQRGAPTGGCPERHSRHYAWAGERSTGLHLDEALAFLRDRRREMSERERELARVGSIARLAVAGSALTAVAAGAFGAPRDLVLGAGIATGAGYVLGNGFAPQAMRDVFNAGAAALSCVETRALSARITPVRVDAAKQREVQAAIATLEQRVREAQALLGPEPNPPPLTQAIAEANAALSNARAVIGNLEGAPLAGPLIANAVQDRVMAIVIQVNSEIDRATPNLDAIMNLARNSGGTSVSGLADAGAALREAVVNARKTEASGRQAAAAPAGSLSLENNLTARMSGVAAMEALDREQGRNNAIAALGRAAGELAAKLDEFSLSLASLRADPVTQIRSCAFQQAEGRGMNVSPGTVPTVNQGRDTAVLSVTGGRGPYRLTPTGARHAQLTAEPEFSPGQFTLRNNGALLGESATFLLNDQSAESVVITLIVRAPTR